MFVSRQRLLHEKLLWLHPTFRNEDYGQHGPGSHVHRQAASLRHLLVPLLSSGGATSLPPLDRRGAHHLSYSVRCFRTSNAKLVVRTFRRIAAEIEPQGALCSACFPRSSAFTQHKACREDIFTSFTSIKSGAQVGSEGCVRVWLELVLGPCFTD